MALTRNGCIRKAKEEGAFLHFNTEAEYAEVLARAEAEHTHPFHKASVVMVGELIVKNRWGKIDPLAPPSHHATSHKSLTQLRDEALRIAVEHGFRDASVGEDIALMHSELSEALEDHRVGRLPHEVRYVVRGTDAVSKSPKPVPGDMDYQRTPLGGQVPEQPLRKPVGIPSEMADVMIRVLHFCGKHGIDIEKAVAEKMAYNASRPFKHGGKTL